jgi:hypothetical protein
MPIVSSACLLRTQAHARRRRCRRRP